MADALSLPMAEIALLLGEGKLKARALVEEAIANHERFGAKLMAYSQWAPEYARLCADAADAAFAVGSERARCKAFRHRSRISSPFGLSNLCRLAQTPAAEIRD